MTPAKKLSEHVDPELPDAALSAQWRRIERRLGEGPSRRPTLLLAAGAFALLSAVAIAVGLHLRGPVTASAWDGAVLDSGKDRVSVALNDGSRIELAPESRVLVREGKPRAVHLDMPKGGAHFQVTHVPGRAFDVTTAGVRIRVVGTEFTVTTARVPEGERVTVGVDQGVVEVERVSGGEPRRIHAGESFTVVTKDEERRSATAEPKKEEDSPPAGAGSAAAPAVDAPQVGITAAGSATGANPMRPQGPGATPSHAADVAQTAQELFEHANAERQAGDARGAAAAYQSLLERYPSDARSGLAAFELGRIRMDQLGDLRGAAVALERAAVSAPGFREDALARLVSAYGTLGDQARCERAQSAYLGSHPNGVHAAAVQKACGHGR